MRAWCLRRSSGTPRMRRLRSKPANQPGKSGRTSRTKRRRRTRRLPSHGLQAKPLPGNGWTRKIGGKTRYRPDGTPLPQIAQPVFGYKSHIAIDRRYGFIRKGTVTSAAEADGGQLRRLVTTANTSSKVWADTAYRSKANEEWLASRMLPSCIHRRKPKGKPMSKATARANGKKSSVRARIEHVFAHQTERGPWPRAGPRKPSEGAMACSSAPSAWQGPRRN